MIVEEKEKEEEGCVYVLWGGGDRRCEKMFKMNGIESKTKSKHIDLIFCFSLSLSLLPISLHPIYSFSLFFQFLRDNIFIWMVYVYKYVWQLKVTTWNESLFITHTYNEQQKVHG